MSRRTQEVAEGLGVEGAKEGQEEVKVGVVEWEEWVDGGACAAEVVVKEE